MKIKIRQDDASSAEINDWHEMNDWIAELRDDSRAEPAGDSRAPRRQPCRASRRWQPHT